MLTKCCSGCCFRLQGMNKFTACLNHSGKEKGKLEESCVSAGAENGTKKVSDAHRKLKIKSER